MADSSSNSASIKVSQYWPWFFFTAAFESLFAIASLFLIPSENGLSIARFGLIGILFLFFIAGIFFGIRARRNPSAFDSLASRYAIISATLLFLISSLTLFLLRYLNPEKLLPYYERVSPLLWVMLIISFQAIIFFTLIKNGFHPKNLNQHKPIYLSAFIAFCLLLSVFCFVALTKIGITPDTAYWGEPGVAIQGWQFAISILLGIITASYLSRFTSPVSLFTFFLPLIIYVTASILWLSVPNDVLASSFYAPIDPPANMPFPYSDAGFYDYLSQSLLIGTDYLSSIPPRPFYVLFLAVLHFFFGQNYPVIITAQTLVLALFPVSLYFLAKKLHSPAAGVVVSLFAIFRELTGLWISSNTRVANSKMFTTDFPTAMAISFTCLIFLWWLERRDFKSTLIAGGSFGLLLLFRTQSLFILPVVFLLAWFAYQRKTKTWIITGIIFGFAMAITVFPWLLHNYTITGKLAFDDPKQMAIIYSQYSFNETFNLQEFDIESKSLGGRIVEFTLQNPGYVFTFIATHILNTEIGGLLSLPLFAHFESLIAPINLYWVGWDGTVAWYNIILLLFYLLILAIGLGVSWRRMSWLGLLPLAFNLGYVLSNGISRFSSWRYNLPVDWVIYFYFAIGIIELFFWLQTLFGKNIESRSSLPDNSEVTLRDVRPQYIFILLAFAFIGSLPWLAKSFAQPRYTSTQQELILQLEANGIAKDELDKFLSQPNAILYEGRMLYPRFYSRGRGVASANPWPAYEIQDFARIGFLVINERNRNNIFITQDPPNFSQGADVIVLGCQREGYIEARLVDFNKQTYQNLPLTQLCD